MIASKFVSIFNLLAIITSLPLLLSHSEFDYRTMFTKHSSNACILINPTGHANSTFVD